MKVEIRSNILGDIAKIRRGVVFKNHATVVDELLQNCQRAKAKNVSVTIKGSKMVVEDDGMGCLDPQAIFEKNTTAWGNEDEAFGEGFFSVFLLADKLKVESHDWVVKVDVLEMFKTGNLMVNVGRVDRKRSGFKVTIEGEKIEKQDWELKSEVTLLGEIAPFSTILNGHRVEKRMLLEIDAPFSKRFENELYEAVLIPSNGYAIIQTFYEHRPVRDHYTGSVGGRLHFRKGMITLKAPDRKEFIWDDKKVEFDKQLRKDIVTLYREFIQQATDSEIDAYANPISEYLDVEDYLSLLVVDETLFDFVRYSNAPENSGEEILEELDEEQVKKAAEEFRELFNVIQYVKEESWSQGSDRKQDRRTGPKLTDVVEKDRKLAWVGASEVEESKLSIRSAEYYGFRVIVARNKLYEQAFRYLGVMHVNSLEEDVEKHYKRENVGSKSRKEERLLWLLDKIVNHFELEAGTFEIADLELQMKYTVEGEEIETELKKVFGLCDREEKKIYLDRSLVDWSKYSYRAKEPNYPNVTPHDYRVLLQVMQTVAHELAHMLFLTEDNTKEHNDAETQIYKEIVRLF